MEQQEAEREFTRLIGEHELLVLKVCHIYAYTEADRKDLYQEIVIQLWKAYPKFKGEAKLSTWLYRVAINTAITGLRKKRPSITSFEPSELPGHLSDDNEAHLQEERLQLLYSAIDKLNDMEKAIVMLYMEERSYQEMQDILGVSQSTLRVRMSRIKEKLREMTKHN